MENQIKRYIELLVKLFESSRDKKKLSQSESEEFNRICKDLFESLIYNPGGLIFVENTDRIDAYKFAIDRLFELYSREEIWEELSQGGFGGLIFEEMDNYADRVKKLKPTFISIKPEIKEFYTYYNEAMRCWLYGLNNSSIIIISSLLENLIKDKIEELNPEEVLEIIKSSDNKYKGIGINFEKLIDIAEYKNFISTDNKDAAHNLRKTRNKIVHTGRMIDTNKSLELIEKTKNIIEELLN
jgi:hypothetical protein